MIFGFNKVELDNNQAAIFQTKKGFTIKTKTFYKGLFNKNDVYIIDISKKDIKIPFVNDFDNQEYLLSMNLSVDLTKTDSLLKYFQNYYELGFSTEHITGLINSSVMSEFFTLKKQLPKNEKLKLLDKAKDIFKSFVSLEEFNFFKLEHCEIYSINQ